MKVWFWPIVVGILSLAGLIVGLVYEGFGDVFAWLTVSIPVALSIWYGWYKGRPAK